MLTIPIESERLRGFEARLGQSLPVGNEGAGVVVAAGSGAYFATATSISLSACFRSRSWLLPASAMK